MLDYASIRETDEHVQGINDDGDVVVVGTKHGLNTAAIVIIIAIVSVIPLAIAVTGITVCLKRKYL
jgi:hypothetical protein